MSNVLKSTDGEAADKPNDSDNRQQLTVEEAETFRAPDGFTPIVGFRRFGIPWPSTGRESYYHLVQKGHHWTPREPTVAECRRPGSKPGVATACSAEVLPVQGCECGLYAWLGIEEALRYYEMTTLMGWVVASVIGWGRVLFDEDFWRAERAQVVAFADPWDTHADKPKIVQERTSRWLTKVASNYGVPVLPLDELREYTLMYGEEYVEHG
jgi:hypothetical protein